MMYYVDWMLTNAQLELIVSDVSVVDYDYGKRNNRKRKKGDFDDTPADKTSIMEANDKWIARYGTSGDAGKGLSIKDILGKSVKTDVGIKID